MRGFLVHVTKGLWFKPPDAGSPYHRRLPMGMLLELLAGGRVSSRGVLADSASAEPTSATATATTPSAVAATAAAATVSSHFSKTRIDLLLGLLENIDEITSLLLVWRTG